MSMLSLNQMLQNGSILKWFSFSYSTVYLRGFIMRIIEDKKNTVYLGAFCALSIKCGVWIISFNHHDKLMK